MIFASVVLRLLASSLARLSALRCWKPSSLSRSEAVSLSSSGRVRMLKLSISLRKVGSPSRSMPKLRTEASRLKSKVSGHSALEQHSSGPRRMSSALHAGQLLIHGERRSVPGTHEAMYGMTSPARSTVTVSPIIICISSRFWALCSEARLMVMPERSTGASCATGVRQFLPKLHSTPSKVVTALALVNV